MMNRTQIRNTLIISAIFILAGAGVVWAHGGYGGMMGYGGGYGGPMMGYGGGYGGPMMGYGYGGGYGPMMGPGYGPMMGPGYGPAYGNLSQDQYNQLDNARQKFYDQTQDLRQKMDQKQYAIQEQLSQPNPDRTKLEALQKDLSALRAQYDKDALNYHLAVRKIAPDATPGPAYGNGYGYRGGYGW